MINCKPKKFYTYLAITTKCFVINLIARSGYLYGVSDFDLGHSEYSVIQLKCWTNGRHVGKLDQSVLDGVVWSSAVTEVFDLASIGEKLHARLGRHGGVYADYRHGATNLVDFAQWGSSGENRVRR